MHSSRMRTIRNSSHLLLGGLPNPSPPEQAPPWEQTSQGADPPGSRPPREQTPPPAEPPNCKACWDNTCNACWESTTPPLDRVTETCKNITFATSLRTVIILLGEDCVNWERVSRKGKRHEARTAALSCHSGFSQTHKISNVILALVFFLICKI